MAGRELEHSEIAYNFVLERLAWPHQYRDCNQRNFQNNGMLFLYIAVHLGNNARPAFACMILLLLWFNYTPLRTIQLGIMTWRLTHNYLIDNCSTGSVVRNFTNFRFWDKKSRKRKLTRHLCIIYLYFSNVEFLSDCENFTADCVIYMLPNY